MKRILFLSKWTLGAAGGLLLAGCISHTDTVYRDVKRVKVRFENDEASRVFHEALSTYSAVQYPHESSTQVKVPLVFKYRTRVVSGPNTAFNQAVAECDTDGDRTITVAEARHFAEQRGQR